MPVLRIGDIKLKLPIVQGGMGVGISLSRLSSAVANEGGIGVIATAGIGMHDLDFAKNLAEANIRALKREIKKARQMTKGFLGVNIMGVLTDYVNMIVTAVSEGIDFLFLGAGLPLSIPRILRQYRLDLRKVKIVPIVSSARAVRVIFKYWAKNYNKIPDAVVVEGPLAGGHLGFSREEIFDPNYRLERIIPEVMDQLKMFEERFNKKVPVIAAGGIYDGRDIWKFFKLGVGGVQMATRFVATEECDADEEFKQAYIKCNKDDIEIIDSPVGMPGRVIRNKFVEEVLKGAKKPFACVWRCLKTCVYDKAPYCIAQALMNAKRGFLKEGFAFAGANVYRINKNVRVKELISELVQELTMCSNKEALLLNNSKNT